MKRYALPAAIVVLVATNLAWVIAAVDQGVTLTHQAVQAEHLRTALRGLVELSHMALEDPTVVDSGITRAELIEALPAAFGPDVFVDQEDGRLFVDELVFTFADGELKRVGLLNFPSSERPGE